MSLMDYLKGPGYKSEAEKLNKELKACQDEYSTLMSKYTDLESLAKDCGVPDVEAVRNLVAAEKKSLEEFQAGVVSAEEAFRYSQERLKNVRKEILVHEEIVSLESFALYVPKYDFVNSSEYKIRLDAIREQQKALIKENAAATGSTDWVVNGKKSEGKKLVNDIKKLLIRSFNNECDQCVDHVKFNNVERSEARIQKSFETCNKLGMVANVSLSKEYLSLKLDELHLAHEFQLKKQEEKEDAKKAREDLREQQKLEQEIRAAREKINKERKHFAAALSSLQTRLEQTPEGQDREGILARISEIQAQSEAIDSEEKAIDYREKNAKAGYVYVISNIGAFGEGVYKIGMTRRLEPMERISELGDASVPFWFDVHAMVFSDNAPALEAKLHEHFSSGRLNKINGRKEFFRADIKEIEDVIRRNYDSAIEVLHEAPAEQYRESLQMTAPSKAIQLAEMAALDE
ncbi:MAG: DUF4041 domain-containing protein [Alcaligenes nematophilus]|uniref:DUF4041 domain-containing protein n=1 Tax=Alcaligenes nematophilus TaxID=2994643 RepID=UPI003CFFDAF2